MQPTMKERIARVLHAKLGYEGWPTPECTQCMDAAEAVSKEFLKPTDWMFMRGQQFAEGGFHRAYEAMIQAAVSEDYLRRKAEGKL